LAAFGEIFNCASIELRVSEAWYVNHKTTLAEEAIDRSLATAKGLTRKYGQQEAQGYKYRGFCDKEVN
jgi:hypothetical protein